MRSDGVKLCGWSKIDSRNYAKIDLTKSFFSLTAWKIKVVKWPNPCLLHLTVWRIKVENDPKPTFP